MPLVRLLPERWQKLIHEALKFGAVGGINTVINYAVFNALALTIFATGQLKATVVATVVATTSSYLMNRHWTYRDRPKSAMRREYSLFFLFNAAGLVIELGALALAKYGLGIEGLLALNIAKTAGLGLGTVFRFWSYRTFVFRAAGPGLLPTHATTADRSTADRGTASGPDRQGAAVDDAVDSTAGHGAAVDSTVGHSIAVDVVGPAGPTADDRLAPLEAEFAESLDVALEAELAVELDAASRQASR